MASCSADRRGSCYCVPCAGLRLPTSSFINCIRPMSAYPTNTNPDFWEYQVHHARLAPSHSRIPDFPVPDTSSAWPGPDASAASTSRSAKRRAAKKARKERYTEPDDAERQCREREVERERLVELVGAARDRYRRAYERWKEFAAAGLGDVVMEDGGSSSGCSGSRPAARPPDGDGSDYGTCGLFRMLSTPAFTAPASPLPSASTPSPLCVPDEWPDTDTDTDTDDDDDNTPHPSFDPSWFFAASTTPPLPHMTLIPPASLGLAEETALVLELLSKAGTVEMELPTQEVSLLRVCENTARLRREAGVAAPVAVRVDGACVVCCDGPADAVLLPCRHLVMCEVSGSVLWWWWWWWVVLMRVDVLRSRAGGGVGVWAWRGDVSGV